jgi:hypothetical protein
MAMDLWIVVLIGSVIFLGLVWGFLFQVSRDPEWPRRGRHRTAARRGADTGRAAA